MTEWLASDYHQQSSMQEAMAAEQLSRLTLQGSERVLDVGCGDGKVTAAIAAHSFPAGSVVGVDPSRAMVTFATEHFRPPAHGNLSFDVADARRLPYREEFDVVVSFNALHWVPEQGEALRAIHTALKPGGRATLRFVPEGPRQCLEDVLEEVRQEPNWAGNFRNFRKPYAHFTLDEYRALAEQAGFRVVQLQLDDKVWDFKTREGFAAFGRALFVEWTRCLPESQWPEFIADVLDRYQKIAADSPSELYLFKFYQMQVELEKG